MMVKLTDNRADIVALWSEAFGDSEEDILYFLDNAKNTQCLAAYDNNEIQAMLFLVACNCGKYIYAACTAKKHRNKGVMTELLNYCTKTQGTLCLIPASDSLIDFYRQRGFDTVIPIDKIEFCQSDEIKEYLLDGFTLSEPIALMRKG